MSERTYQEHLEYCDKNLFTPMTIDEWNESDPERYTPNMSNRTYIFPGGHRLKFGETSLRADQVYPFYVMLCAEVTGHIADLIAMKQIITSLADSIQDHIGKLP